MTTAKQARAAREARKLGEAVAAAEAEVADLRKPGLGQSSFIGSVQQVDLDENVASQIGQQYDGTNAPVTMLGPTPPAPATPVAHNGSGVFGASWDGSFVDATVAPLDFAAVEVHLGDAADFIPDVLPGSVTRWGEILSAGGGRVTKNHDAGSFFIRLVTRSQAGKFSDPSEAVQVDVSSPMDYDGVVSIIGQAGTGNRVFYAGTAPSQSGVTLGDTWRQYDQSATGEIIAEWRWDGGQWLTQQLSGEIVSSLDAGKITAGIIQAAVSIGAAGQVTAGDIEGIMAGLFGDGSFRSYGVADDGTQVLLVSLGGQSDDQIQIVKSPNEPPVATISRDGDIAGATGTFAGDVSIGGTLLMGTLLDPTGPTGVIDVMPRGVQQVASFRDLISGKTVSDGGSLWGGQWAINLLPGRYYRLEMPWQYQLTETSSSNTSYLSVVRWYAETKTDGTTPPDPTTSSPILCASPTNRWAQGSSNRSGVLLATFSPTVATTVKVALYMAPTRASMSPIVDVPEVFIASLYDMGAAPEILPAAAMGATAQQKYVTTWTASDSRTYDKDGVVINTGRTSSPQTNYLYYGNANFGSNGIQKSAVVFNGSSVAGETGKTIAQALAGATITKIEMRFYANYWEQGKGQLRLRKFTGSALKSTESTAASGANASGRLSFDYGATGWGQWWTITDTSWITTTNRGIYLDTADCTSPSNHGTFDGATGSNKPQVRITYTK